MRTRTVNHHGRTISYYENESTAGRIVLLITPPGPGLKGVQAFADRTDIPWKSYLFNPTARSVTAAADEVLALAAALELRNYTLVGMSSGAFPALLVAARIPQMTDALVLIEPPINRQGLSTAVGSEESLTLDYPIWDATSMTRCPTLIVRGGESDVFPSDALDYLRITMMSSMTRTLPGVGHQVLRDAPDATAATLSHFLFPRRRRLRVHDPG